jgi:hypothetical protein
VPGGEVAEAADRSRVKHRTAPAGSRRHLGEQERIGHLPEYLGTFAMGRRAFRPNRRQPAEATLTDAER